MKKIGFDSKVNIDLCEKLIKSYKLNVNNINNFFIYHQV